MFNGSGFQSSFFEAEGFKGVEGYCFAVGGVRLRGLLSLSVRSAGLGLSDFL